MQPAAPAAAPEETFAGLLAGFREVLEGELAAWFEARRTELAPLPAPAADALRELIDGVGQLASYGGKRLRPAFVYYSYLGCGGRSDVRVVGPGAPNRLGKGNRRLR